MRREWLAALACVACASPPPPPACPSGTHADPARAAEIEARLAAVPEGRAWIERGRDRVAALCFGAPTSASVITSERVAILSSALETSEAAARLAHLIVHAREGLPIDRVPEGTDAAHCAGAVHEALALEADAYVVEITLQRALDAHPRVLAFEMSEAVLAVPASERRAIVLAWLVSHPHGGAGIEGLGDAYASRCR